MTDLISPDVAVPEPADLAGQPYAYRGPSWWSLTGPGSPG